MEIRFNGEVFSPINGPAANNPEGTFELRARDSIFLLLTETGETAPAGRYRVGVSGDRYLVQRDNGSGGWTDLLNLDADGLELGARAVNALNVIRVAAAVEDGETLVIGDDTFEFFTEDTEALDNAGAIGVDVSGGSTVKSQGTLTVDTQPTVGDTMTIDGKVFTFTADTTADEDGEIDVGTDLADAKTNIVAAINGTDGVNTAHTSVTAAAFSGNDCVLTAIKGGTAGDSIATTETFTAGTNVFDAATLGTTTAGVDPPAAEASDALIAAINASATESIVAVDISANEILVIFTTAGADTTAFTESMAGTNNALASATAYGGAAAGQHKTRAQSRVPNATEVALGNMHFAFDFDPIFVDVLVTVTSTGAQKKWDGVITITPAAGGVPARVELDNAGSTDWAATDTVRLYAIG